MSARKKHLAFRAELAKALDTLSSRERRELMTLVFKLRNEPLTEQSSQKRCEEYVDETGRLFQLLQKAGLAHDDAIVAVSQLRDES